MKKFLQIALAVLCVLSINKVAASDPDYNKLSEHDKRLLQKMYPDKNFNENAPNWKWDPPSTSDQAHYRPNQSSQQQYSQQKQQQYGYGQYGGNQPPSGY